VPTELLDDLSQVVRSKERNVSLGVIPIRIAKDQTGKTHKFIRGIEVKRNRSSRPRCNGRSLA